MMKLQVNIQNCYGIGKFEKEFENDIKFFSR